MTEEATTKSTVSRKKPIRHKGNWNFTLLDRRLKQAEKKLRELNLTEEAELLRTARTGIAHLLSMPVLVQNAEYPELTRCLISIDWPLLKRQYREINKIVPLHLRDAPNLGGVENMLEALLENAQADDIDIH